LIKQPSHATTCERIESVNKRRLKSAVGANILSGPISWQLQWASNKVVVVVYQKRFKTKFRKIIDNQFAKIFICTS